MTASVSPSGLLLLPVRWLKVRDGYWRATVDGHECSLRMNDFPDEPLFTVAVEGTSIEIDDAPRTWCIESMTGDREADIVRGKSGRGCG